MAFNNNPRPITDDIHTSTDDGTLLRLRANSLDGKVRFQVTPSYAHGPTRGNRVFLQVYYSNRS